MLGSDNVALNELSSSKAFLPVVTKTNKTLSRKMPLNLIHLKAI